MTPPRILVVEDEAIVALHLCQQLLKLGYEVTESAATGDLALQTIASARPDLVLMDITLKGGMDGIVTTSRIPPEHKLPVVFLTGSAEETTLARARATHPFGYLLKPFHERELHATIQMALARYRAECAWNEAIEHRHKEEKMSALAHFAGDVAEDLDGLLMEFYGHLEVLGRHSIAHPRIAPALHDAFGVAITQERLIRRLSAFAGRQKLSPSRIGVSQITAQMINALRHILGETIEIRTELAGGIWDIWVDADQLTVALSHLARNARDAMPDGGSFTIDARNTTLDNGRHVVLTISDTGRGMSKGEIRRAFEPFFTTKPDGEGLGLSLVYGLIRQSGGQISIDSDVHGHGGPGRGTTIRLYLPCQPTADNAKLELPRRDKIPAMPHLSAHAPAVPARDTGGFGGLPTIAWYKAGNALYAAARSTGGEARHRLIIEPLPHKNAWDWAVWASENSHEMSRHGRASSVMSAMAAAEAAARLLASGTANGTT